MRGTFKSVNYNLFIRVYLNLRTIYDHTSIYFKKNLMKKNFYMKFIDNYSL